MLTFDLETFSNIKSKCKSIISFTGYKFLYNVFCFERSKC